MRITSSDSVGGMDYSNYSSLSKIASAADDPAGKAIAEKMTTQANGYDTGNNNIKAGKNAIDIADGSIESISKQLQRMRELAVEASSSAIYSHPEIKSIQKEIDSIKDSIDLIAKTTQFNTKNLLDGSNETMNIATNGYGGMTQLTNGNYTIKALGLSDFDVTGDFSIDDIDTALDKVTEGRSSLGAQSNSLSYLESYNSNASYNTTASKSNIEDLDIGEYLSAKEKDKVMEQYKIFAQKEQINNESNNNLINKMFNN